MTALLTERSDSPITLTPLTAPELSEWLAQQPPWTQQWLAATGFKAQTGQYSLIPDETGQLHQVVVGVETYDVWAFAGLPLTLPEGVYQLDRSTAGCAALTEAALTRLMTGWGLGAYQFTRYKAASRVPASMVLPSECRATAVRRQVQALYSVRDLINTPADDLMPEQLAQVATALAQRYGAQITQYVGDELLTQYPTIYAVGRASSHPPRLIDLRWGAPNHPTCTLVGKGVCFDSGGLDIKTASQMRLMKKDMAGAAHALGLAQWIMDSTLPVRLRVLLPTVENAIAGNALHPGDVIKTRHGLTVEIHNTDAEGRLILCDALAEAVTEKPDVLIDFATLTGAARVALGTDIPALFCNQEALAEAVLAAARVENDPVWRLPLHPPYREMLKSTVADVANASDSAFAGAITAALFLNYFVPNDVSWLHLDMMAWNSKTRPGRPEGGEAMGLRALFHYLEQRFGNP